MKISVGSGWHGERRSFDMQQQQLTLAEVDTPQCVKPGVSPFKVGIRAYPLENAAPPTSFSPILKPVELDQSDGERIIDLSHWEEVWG